MNQISGAMYIMNGINLKLTNPYPGCIPRQPSRLAISIIRSPSRYAETEPKLNANGELKACWARESGSV